MNQDRVNFEFGRKYVKTVTICLDKIVFVCFLQFLSSSGDLWPSFGPRKLKSEKKILVKLKIKTNLLLIIYQNLMIKIQEMVTKLKMFSSFGHF